MRANGADMIRSEAGDSARIIDHGGDLARARALFPDAPEPWIDLSTGISPHPYPLFELPAKAWARLPEAAAERNLQECAARAYGAPAAINVVAAPGTQILLPRAAALVPPGRARVLGPTYAEHARALALAGHVVETVGAFADLAEADIAVVVNPNNPDGRVIARDDLLALARALRPRGGLLIVDEAFMDVGPPAAAVDGDVEHLPILVLRSFGKFYGLAGLRLGFAITRAKFAARLRDELGPWATSGPALAIGARALADGRWRDEARARLEKDSARIDELLKPSGVAVCGGVSLYRYVEMARARDLFGALGRAGIWTRVFAERPNALRIGLPDSEADWARLRAALTEFKRV